MTNGYGDLAILAIVAFAIACWRPILWAFYHYGSQPRIVIPLIILFLLILNLIRRIT